MNPLSLFSRDRTRASGDPMAALCTVATVDNRGKPQLRTLALRDVDSHLAIFVNATSPKWADLQHDFAVHTYWPSIAVQYRMQVTSEPIDAQKVHASWQLRPDMPKQMDWFYEQIAPQSSVIESRGQLHQQLNGANLGTPVAAPTNARGLYLRPFIVERLDLNQPDGLHDRTRYQLDGDHWHCQTLVP
ncbi:pyridoxamine 5'-phosphate oxidase family protein [bacterium]|nr:pyridoxamine 5'-phosphate oxidase family protein [bacterium]